MSMRIELLLTVISLSFLSCQTFALFANSTSPDPVDIVQDRTTYAAIDVRDLKKSPDSFRDKKLTFRGLVIAIQENSSGTEMQMRVPFPGGHLFEYALITVHFAGKLPGLYEGQEAVIYGNGGGMTEIKFGTVLSTRQPLVVATYVDYGDAIPTATPTATFTPFPRPTFAPIPLPFPLRTPQRP